MTVAPASKPIRILFVEDDDVVRAFFAEELASAGFAVTPIGLAEQALDALASAQPQAIVLDLGMPAGTMQGMEFLARLREDPTWRTVPVVILSALGDVVNRDVTARLAVAAILSKPLADVRRLIEVIRHVTGGQRP